MFSVRWFRICSSGSVPTRGLRGVGGNSKLTLGEVLDKWQKKFLKCGISEPKESAEYIIAHILRTKTVADVYRHSQKVLLPADIRRIDNLCSKRLQRMPLQYVIQEWDFRDLTLKMSRPVFIPRPETEILVDIVLNEIDSKRADKVLELCCGSGAISLALLKARPELQATAVDKSEHACKLSKENAEINNLSDRIHVIQAELKEDFTLNSGKFDIVVGNPPYVPTKDLDHLQPEILMYEDLGALDGGNDGLTVIKSIFKACSRLLNCGGKLFLEVDPSHPTLINSWLQENEGLRLTFLRSFQDFSGRERFVEIIKKGWRL